MMHLLPHWNWTEGETVRVMTVTNCEEAELFLNGESLGRRKSDCCDQCVWEVKFVPGRIKAVGYNGGIAVATAENVTTGAPKRIVIEPDREMIKNDGMDTVAINLSVVDENGVTVENASNLLHFEVVGGNLLGVGNGDPNCLESDHEPMRSLFAGHAQALVQSVVGTDRITFRATGSGLEDAEIELKVIDVPRPEYIYAATNRSLGGFTMTAETFESEPDALIEIADNDMNTFEPIGFDPWHVKPGIRSGWKLFRGFFNIPSSADPDAKGICTLTFKAVFASEFKVWVDGKQVYSGTPEAGKPLNVSFGYDKPGKVELRASLKAIDGAESGFRQGVSMKVE